MMYSLHMDLKTFLKSMSLTERVGFADKCGTTYPHLRNVAYGLRKAAEKLSIAIERESGGLVRCEELRPDVDWAYIRGTAKHAA